MEISSETAGQRLERSKPKPHLFVIVLFLQLGAGGSPTLLLLLFPVYSILSSLFLKAMATLAQYLQNKGIRLVAPFEDHQQATVTIAEAVAVKEEEEEEVTEEDTISSNSY